MEKKYKMVSINYTYDCAKKPRCSFCYLKTPEILSRFLGSKEPYFLSFNLETMIEKLTKQTEQVAVAYNGVQVGQLVRVAKLCRISNPKVILNVTLNPEIVTFDLAFILKRLKFRMVALSFDIEKCGSGSLLPPSIWIQAALDLRKAGLLVSANILMTDEIYQVIEEIIEAIESYCKQIHLLRPKFYKQNLDVSERRARLFLVKNRWKKLIFIDQCFKFEFFNEPCTRGKDFISVNPDGTTSLCSFDIHRDNKKKLKNCPYI